MFLVGEASGGQVTCELGSLPIDPAYTGPVEVMLRPEDLQISLNEAGPASIIDREYFGHDQLLTIRLESGAQLQSRLLGSEEGFYPGQRVEVQVRGQVVVYPA
jgi:iron(III) transport system ATP-binding protein